MSHFYIGLITTAAVVSIIELLRKSDSRLIASLTLTGIAFIYIGFSWHDRLSLGVSALAVGLFFFLSYFGYKKNFNVTILGLVLHGAWDILFPFFSDAAPQGYGIFCLTVDFLLAVYFFIRITRAKAG